MAFKADLAYQSLVASIVMVLFPIALIIYAFSGFELRHRSEKAACQAGKVDACLAVAKVYEDDAPGLWGFLLDKTETARIHYDEACTLGAMPACLSLGRLILHGAETAGDSKFSFADAARAFEKACAAHLADACDALGLLYTDPYRMKVDEVRAAQAFSDGCTGGNLDACYRLADFLVRGRGGLTTDPERALQLYTQVCDAPGGTVDACTAVAKYKKKGRFE